MALDSQEKRMAVLGVARPWMRSKLPGANDAEWRASSGNTYGGNAFAAPVITMIAKINGVVVTGLRAIG